VFLLTSLGDLIVVQNNFWKLCGVSGNISSVCQNV